MTAACSLCKGEGGSYDPCGEDYSMVWSACCECGGSGEIAMKLNLGCGNKRIDGFFGVDKFASDAVDVVHDLEVLPWPWGTDSVEAVMMHHVLEHLGEQTSVYLGIIRELYRVCRHGAVIKIRVPHPRHSDFLNDPTHVRPITAESFLLFSQKMCRERIAGGFADTPLAIHLGVDFEITHVGAMLEPEWHGHENLDWAVLVFNNVVKEVSINLKVIKA